MLKKLKVKNFRSLRDFDLEFGKFNVLIGENASGKSNILDCINFLRDAVSSGLYHAIERRRLFRGYSDIVYSYDDENIITIEAEFEIKRKNVKYNLSFSGKYEKVKVENLSIEIDGNPIKIGPLGEAITFRDVIPFPDIGRYDTSAEIVEYKGVLAALKRNICSITQYNFNIPSIKRSFYGAFERYTVDESGTNIVQVLDTLQLTYGKIYNEISENFADIYPSHNIAIIPKEASRCIGISEKIDKKEIRFPAMYVSDGMIKVLALLTVLSTTKFFKKEHDIDAADMPLFLFEEIENSLYPKTIWKILELMKASDCQIILTTHSPYVLNQLEPEDVIIVKKGENGTIAVRKPEKINDLIKKYQWKIGDLWEMGDLDNLLK